MLIAAPTNDSECSMRWKPTMARPARGEIWRVDLGLSAKVRPCLVMSDYPAENELALMLVIPHTTAVRGNRWEFACIKPFLKPGVFHLQQIQPISLPKLEAKLGSMTENELRGLGKQLAELLHLEA
jgi:mRNA interferase MazF